MTTALKLDKRTFRHVEKELYDYPETKKEIQRLRNEILYRTAPPDENIGGSRGNMPGNPTEHIATALMTNRRIEYLERVINAIESVYERLPPEKKKLVELRYWSTWEKSWSHIADAIGISVPLAYIWRREIVFAIAERLGWR